LFFEPFQDFQKEGKNLLFIFHMSLPENPETASGCFLFGLFADAQEVLVNSRNHRMNMFFWLYCVFDLQFESLNIPVMMD
jgi:hypothetical protein